MALPSGAKVLVSGVSGPIGKALLPALQAQGWRITRLMRGGAPGPNQIPWDTETPLAPESVSGFDAVIHLAGDSINGRWTSNKKELIRNTRVHGTQNLTAALAQAAVKPRVLVAASAIGYYGDRGDEILREDSRSGIGFLPKVCREWEGASQAAADAGIRTAIIRSGVVLSLTGGALAQMLPPFRLGLGGRLGSGRQWWSWIHIDDMVGAVLRILAKDDLQGPVNLVAPNPSTNAEFTHTLGRVLSRPALLLVPAFALKLKFGSQMVREALLASQRVEPAKLASNGYSFSHPDLERALTALLRG
jgi:uncharacterized protein (TIGR01777 family)